MDLTIIGDTASRSHGFSVFAVLCVAALVWYGARKLAYEGINRYLKPWRATDRAPVPVEPFPGPNAGQAVSQSREQMATRDRNQFALLKNGATLVGLALIVYVFGFSILGEALDGGQLFAMLVAPVCWEATWWLWRHNKTTRNQSNDMRWVHRIGITTSALAGLTLFWVAFL